MSRINTTVLLMDETRAIDDRGVHCTSKRIPMGTLILVSSKILACDPFNADTTLAPYTTDVPVGAHRAYLSIVLYPDGDRRIAYATIWFTPNKPAYWRRADTEADNDPNTFVGYVVDSGTGCFVDASGLSLLRPKTIERDAYPDDFSWTLALANDSQSNRVRALEQQLTADENGLWTDVTLDAETGMNLLAFHTGWGDGAYESFFGYDEDGTLACLTTDFLVL